MPPLLRAPRSAVAAFTLVVILGPMAYSAGAETTARGGIDHAYVLGARKGQKLVLTDAAGRTVSTGRADRLGSKIFRSLEPGGGYRVRAGRRRTRPFRVLRAGANPPQSFYRRKKLKQGLNYVTMRDGVELAMTVRLPAGKTLADGPFPTFIEYSGYQVAAPHDLLSSVIGSLTGGGGASDPLAPATSTAVGSLLGPLLGFAVVRCRCAARGAPAGPSTSSTCPPPTTAMTPWRRWPPSRGSGAAWSAWRGSRSRASPSSSRRARDRRTWRQSRRCPSTTTSTPPPATRAASSTPGSPGRGSWSG